MKKITSKLVLEKDRTHALLNDVSNCWFPESIFIQIKKEINSNQLFYSNINDENGLANSFNMMTACVWYKKNFLHMTLLVVAVALLLLLMLLLLSCSCCVVVVEGLSTSPPPTTPTCWPRSPSSKVNSTPPHRKYWPGWKR